ncbi:MAG: exonuclease SbcCD subunit D, partial [Halobacteria archaeon]|nr:exonuclease SbcCD subunit D [Halobacteria archaeon]
MKIIHTGDTHLGYSQYGSDERRKDFLDAFEQVVEDAVDEEVDVLVHAGDLFHSRNPSLRDVIPTVELFERLDEADVETFAVVGNHEKKRDSQWLDLLENLGLVTRLSPEPVAVESRGEEVAFYGVDYLPRTTAESFDYDFEPSDAGVNLLVLHGRFKPFPYGEWDLREFADNSEVDWDGYLLGDYHHHETEEIEGAWATYCGSTERASTEEREARGYNIVEVEDGDVSISRRSLETRSFVFVDVDLTGKGERNATREVIERAREHDVEDSVVILDVDGESDEEVVQSEVEEAVLDEGALVVRVNDRRETDEETDLDVTFVDPDDAVEDRVEELGLSGVADRIDRVVRGEDVPKSKLADEVEERVESLAEDSLGEFEGVEKEEESEDDDTWNRTPETDEETEDGGGGSADGSEEGTK